MTTLKLYIAKRKRYIADGQISKVKELTDVINVLQRNKIRMSHFGINLEKCNAKKTFSFRFM